MLCATQTQNPKGWISFYSQPTLLTPTVTEELWSKLLPQVALVAFAKISNLQIPVTSILWGKFDWSPIVPRVGLPRTEDLSPNLKSPKQFMKITSSPTYQAHFLKKIYLFLFVCVSVCLCVCMCTTYMPGAQGGLKKMPNPRKLEVQEIMSHHVSSGPLQVLSHLFSPNMSQCFLCSKSLSPHNNPHNIM